MKIISPLFLIVALISSSATAAVDTSAAQKTYKSSFDNEEGFAGPGSTVRQLEEDDEEKTPVFRFETLDEALAPWFEWKKGLAEEQGLQLGISYTITSQHASDSLTDEDTGTTGIVRVQGKWELLNRGQKNKGSLVFSVDNRANYGDVAAADLSAEIGYIGPTATLFSAPDTVLVDFNWQQYINDGQTGILVGRYDPSDYMHVLGYSNPWTTFQNLNTLLDSSVAYPDAGFGAGIGHWFNQNWYGITGFNDANGRIDETHIFDNGSEFFKFAEVGWSPSRDERYFTNVHLFVWDVDERDDDGIDDAHGAAIGMNYTSEQTWMVFAKIGWSDADAPNDPQIYEESYSVGGIYYFADRSDLAGIAINRGELAAEGLVSDTQTTTEIFYRVQFSRNLAITPSIQLLEDPALNDEDDSITVFGLRLRLTL
jgi:porin